MAKIFRITRHDLLSQAAWCSLKQCLGHAGAELAVVLSLQTNGKALNFNPHLHRIVADRLFMPDGSFKPFECIDTDRLCCSFCDHLLAALHKKALITDETVSQVLSQQHTGCSVWCGEPFQDADSERFVARYIERGPVSLTKLSITDDIITYTTSDGTAHEFDALEFLALLSSQVPRPYESLTRYYGFYSCRVRGKGKNMLRPSSSIKNRYRKLYQNPPQTGPLV